MLTITHCNLCGCGYSAPKRYKMELICISYLPSLDLLLRKFSNHVSQVNKMLVTCNAFHTATGNDCHLSEIVFCVYCAESISEVVCTQCNKNKRQFAGILSITDSVHGVEQHPRQH